MHPEQGQLPAQVVSLLTVQKLFPDLALFR
jgi:hypothetical protein